jgi:pimeloyl-ACP methyl ester carboxylesterase
MITDESVLLPDGRVIAFTIIGDPVGPTVCYQHGAPGGRLELLGLDAAFADAGVRVISADRPGYGVSTPAPGRTTESWPADVAALADHLGVERFAVIGLSSGGPYAVACASLLGPRVIGALVAAGNTDMSWPQARDGYLESELVMMGLDDEDAAVAYCIERYGADGSRFFEGEMDLGAADNVWLADPENTEALFATMRDAFRQGVGGYAQDITVQGRPWNFDPSAIACPVIVAHGEDDQLVPIEHSRHTASLIPGSELRIVERCGHLSLIDTFPSFAAELTVTLR